MCDGALSIQYFYSLPLNTLLSCSWFLWNNEARQFIYRKVTTSCTTIFARRSRRVEPFTLVEQNYSIHVVEKNYTRRVAPLPVREQNYSRRVAPLTEVKQNYRRRVSPLPVKMWNYSRWVTTLHLVEQNYNRRVSPSPAVEQNYSRRVAPLPVVE